MKRQEVYDAVIIYSDKNLCIQLSKCQYKAFQEDLKHLFGIESKQTLSIFYEDLIQQKKLPISHEKSMAEAFKYMESKQNQTIILIVIDN